MSLFLSHCLPRAKPRTRCFIITLFMSPTRQLRCRHRWNTEVNRSPSYCCHSAALSVRNHPNSIGFVVAGAWTLRRLEILIQAVNKRPRPPPERRRLFWLGDGFAYLCRRRIAEMEQQLAEGSAYLKKLKVICFVFVLFSAADALSPVPLVCDAVRTQDGFRVAYAVLHDAAWISRFGLRTYLALFQSGQRRLIRPVMS